MKAGIDFHWHILQSVKIQAGRMQVSKQSQKLWVDIHQNVRISQKPYTARHSTEFIEFLHASFAEATKLLENIFRSVNIALVNELKVVYEAMGIDVHEVIDEAATKPLVTWRLSIVQVWEDITSPSIPLSYLKAWEFGKNTRFIELAGEINTTMPDYVISKVTNALNEEGKSVKGSKILVLGLAYKANVDDCRESPSFVLMEKLEAKGASVEFNDDFFVPVVPTTREHGHFTGKKSVVIEDIYDLILLSTNHSEYKNFDLATMLLQ